ncbi:MAG: aminodeoxychorismate synthase component I [Porticoccaceae bacterium]
MPRETRETVINLLRSPDKPAPVSHFQLTGRFEASETREKYLYSIEQIKDYICAGDVYQVNYAQHFWASYRGDTVSAYLNQRAQHPAPFSAYIGLGDGKAVISHSPEEFLNVLGREVQTQPIKGTAPRSSDAETDQQNAENLQSSAKDRAENLMIVDLLRNDLGKACKPGSISVPRLFELQSFSNVHHLVSKVQGLLREDVSILELLRLCHPGGSITGAPKQRAMEIIAQLETVTRSLYCGSIGYISLCGRSHTNIAIRTMIADGTHIHCWGGGGIVADSDAHKEYQETLFKIGPMMESLERHLRRDTI